MSKTKKQNKNSWSVKPQTSSLKRLREWNNLWQVWFFHQRGKEEREKITYAIHRTRNEIAADNNVLYCNRI